MYTEGILLIIYYRNLQLLVQHGADLRARNKNNETPYDICEDLELRDRMTQLLSEQDTRRMTEHGRKVRINPRTTIASHSNSM